jgi:hypothetical protein
MYITARKIHTIKVRELKRRCDSRPVSADQRRAGLKSEWSPQSVTRFKEIIMDVNQGQSRASEEEQKPKVEESPSEKLEGEKPTGSLVPGAENPESEEIKHEKNLNTE